MLNVFETFIGKKEIFYSYLVRFQKKVMLFVSSTLLFLVNAVTFRRERSILFNRVAILILLFSVIVWYNSLNIASLDIWEDIYGGLFHLTFITYSFALFLCIIRAIVFFFCILPQTFTKINGSYGKENFFLLVNPIYR